MCRENSVDRIQPRPWFQAWRGSRDRSPEIRGDNCKQILTERPTRPASPPPHTATASPDTSALHPHRCAARDPASAHSGPTWAPAARHAAPRRARGPERPRSEWLGRPGTHAPGLGPQGLIMEPGSAPHHGPPGKPPALCGPGCSLQVYTDLGAMLLGSNPSSSTSQQRDSKYNLTSPCLSLLVYKIYKTLLIPT